ncbi:hypothetical protein VF14_05730 [Nostoc linckia z18]|uniref:Uncharacterized protein n=2 Tax=Nostoc linckia TaxID=92942 RepID=A0A9Q5ZE87_NOSLI|nr:hypothetical protein [Nostoc linckia]PHJ88185.1 hypothetical protein VF07_16980 [Nostoc linckia z6]PHK27485.1 hypothetical protein VF12_34865 [Nostoc linckia z15]PHK36537.1 hypothetical protein VF14_05730 [Nostoc linckia z18]PHK47742.1 hypothetical protein VF13_03590 [Nostoc linckia z16]PHJ65960.1 hypothetical protein VF02_08935 [Nostoc linckia z1]
MPEILIYHFIVFSLRLVQPNKIKSFNFFKADDRKFKNKIKRIGLTQKLMISYNFCINTLVFAVKHLDVFQDERSPIFQFDITIKFM